MTFPRIIMSLISQNKNDRENNIFNPKMVVKFTISVPNCCFSSSIKQSVNSSLKTVSYQQLKVQFKTNDTFSRLKNGKEPEKAAFSRNAVTFEQSFCLKDSKSEQSCWVHASLISLMQFSVTHKVQSFVCFSRKT